MLYVGDQKWFDWVMQDDTCLVSDRTMLRYPRAVLEFVRVTIQSILPLKAKVTNVFACVRALRIEH